ncbi:MAG: restriction endonuclease subunit S [Propionivibrio sp.]|nr:restriction endonuclease subunit S [Propionivibrio sp.]
MNYRLSDLVELRAGHPFRGSVPEAADGNAYALQMRDVSPEAGVAWGGLVRTGLDTRKSPDWLQRGDVVFVARGMRNYALCMDEVPMPTVCSQYFFLLRVRSAPLLPSLLPEFLAWQINRAPAQRYLASNAEGSDQLSIRRGVLEDLPLVVPPIEQQQRIVALGDAARRERQLLEQLIFNGEKQLDALAYELHAAHLQHR